MPALKPLVAFTVICRTPFDQAKPPQSGVPVASTIAAKETEDDCTPGSYVAPVAPDTAVQPVVEVPVGAVCIPLREYHW
jgi:hypothetical protein